MALIGYARVSTDEQTTAAQMDALRAAGCTEVFEEKASGASRARPELARALARIGRGDTLVIWKLDRLGRSLSHLLEVIEDLRDRGSHFRCLTSPIDTASPHGTLVLQMLGAVAEYERSLIRERTRAGLKAAKGDGNDCFHEFTHRPSSDQLQVLEWCRVPISTLMRNGPRWATASEHGRSREHSCRNG